MRGESKLSVCVRVLVFVLTGIIMVVPFLWMLLTSFKTNSEAVQVNPFVIFPSSLRLDAWKSVAESMDFLILYRNTFLMILFRIVCAVVTANLAGYALARLHFAGRSIAFSLILFQMMMPAQIFIIPQYLMVSSVGLTNTIFALVFPGLVSAFGSFLLRQAYLSLPASLEEAARIDGCSIGQCFLFVMSPLVKANTVALSVFTAVFAFKDLMWPLIINTRKDMLVLSSALARMQSQYYTDYPGLMAASVLACLPMILLYLIFQRQFVQGIATSGSKL